MLQGDRGINTVLLPSWWGGVGSYWGSPMLIRSCFSEQAPTRNSKKKLSSNMHILIFTRVAGFYVVPELSVCQLFGANNWKSCTGKIIFCTFSFFYNGKRCTGWGSNQFCYLYIANKGLVSSVRLREIAVSKQRYLSENEKDVYSQRRKMSFLKIL